MNDRSENIDTLTMDDDYGPIPHIAKSSSPRLIENRGSLPFRMSSGSDSRALGSQGKYSSNLSSSKDNESNFSVNDEMMATP